MTAIGSSHQVHLVAGPAGSMVVKQADAETVRRGRSLAAEAFVYRLASWRPGLAAAVPRAHLIDEAGQVVVLEAPDGMRAAAEMIWTGSRSRAAASRLLGGALAGVHAATWGLPFPSAASSGVLDLPTADRAGVSLDRGLDLAMSVAADPLLSAGLRRARSLWRPSCLVHGDVKWENCLIDGADPPERLLLIDWEMSGGGDPAWDLAAALAASTALELDSGSPDERSRRALVQGYYERGGPADPVRAAFYWPARLVHTALECAEAGADAAAGRLLERAAALLADPGAGAGRMAAWARDCRSG